MSARSWLRENLFLVAAVALPLLVAVFFVLASALPRWLVEPPRYDLLFTAAGFGLRSEVDRWLEYRVRDGRLEAELHRREKGRVRAVPKLFRFDHETLESVEVEVEIPGDLAEGDPFPVEAFADLRLLASPRAPDGYTLGDVDRSSPGLLVDLLGMGRRRSLLVIEKQGRVVPIRPPADVGPGSWFVHRADFLGWLRGE